MPQQAFIVTDLSFGDAGKGTTVDYLVRHAASALVVRHNGGAQAAHNVVLPDGTHHTFAQFGSGSFVPGVRTHLSRFMVVNPLTMLNESLHLEPLVPDIWQRVSIDRQALVTTPWQQMANQLRELARGEERHGSCGLGVGETMADFVERPGFSVRVGDLERSDLFRRLITARNAKLEQLKTELGDWFTAQKQRQFLSQVDTGALIDMYQAWLEKVTLVDGDYLRRLAAQHELLVFEGAQGVLLDEWYGFHPYTTWSTTTPANALTLLEEINFEAPVTKLGILRAYTTRHGAGPFVTEDATLTAQLPDYHNGVGEWQGSFRVGYFDLVAHRYALEVCQDIDQLVVTGLDRVAALGQLPICTGYQLEQPTADANHFFRRNTEGVVTAIKPGTLGDLDYQARLTELLQSCTPVYRMVSAPSGMPDSQDEFLRTIEVSLGRKIALTSYGPTWIDKHAPMLA